MKYRIEDDWDALIDQKKKKFIALSLNEMS